MKHDLSLSARPEVTIPPDLVGRPRYVVRTTARFGADRGFIWSLLLRSSARTPRPAIFRLGLPRPIEHRLAEGRGGEGFTRESFYDRGIARSRIQEWAPRRRLVTELTEATVPGAEWIGGLSDRFELEDDPRGGAWVLRTTSFSTRGPSSFALAGLKAAALALGIKQLHRYTFRDWQVRLQQARLAAPQLEGGRRIRLEVAR